MEQPLHSLAKEGYVDHEGARIWYGTAGKGEPVILLHGGMESSLSWGIRFHVTRVLVCDPRKNALLKVGNKSDRIDSRKLAELLRSNLLGSVYHEQKGYEP